MGEIRVQCEWSVEVPQPRSLVSLASAELSTADSGSTPASEGGKNGDASSSTSSKLCPLQQSEAFDWIPSVAILGDGGLEVSGLIVSLLDIVSVRVSSPLAQCSPEAQVGETAPITAWGASVETEASETEGYSPETETGAAATSAAASGKAEAHTTVAEKENVFWQEDRRKHHHHLVVCLRSQLPTEAADPPLYPPPAGADPDVGSCLVMRLSAAADAAAGGLHSSSSGTGNDACEATAAVLLLQQLQKFISRVRPVFCSLRKSASMAEDIRSRFKQQQLLQQQTQLAPAAAAAAEVERLKGQQQMKALLGGFLLRDCAALEEAVAYAPLAVYLHLGATTALLPSLPVEPPLYPTWRRVMLQHRRQQQLKQQQSSLSSSSALSQLRGASSRRPACAGEGREAGPGASSSVPFKLDAGGCRLAKGSSSCCEDAFMCLKEEGVFGVFDGVGSWAVEGIDASRFSEGLAAAAAAEAAAHLNPHRVSPAYLPLDANERARLLLQRAHEAVCNSPESLWGSSTAAVGCIDRKTGRLGVACLGDSVVMVLRRQLLPSSMSFFASEAPALRPEALLLSSSNSTSGSSSSSGSAFPCLLRRCCWRSKDQRWENGAPYQLCNLPPRSSWALLREEGFERFVSVLERIDPQGDSANMAGAPPQPLLLQPGDLILAFSDGVADNLFIQEIETFCSLALSPDEAAMLQQQQRQQQQQQQIAFTPAQDVAELIVKIAKRRSADGLFERPFVSVPAGSVGTPADMSRLLSASEEGPRGGKRDDISCVAIWVTSASPLHAGASQEATPAAAATADAAFPHGVSAASSPLRGFSSLAAASSPGKVALITQAAATAAATTAAATTAATTTAAATTETATTEAATATTSAVDLLHQALSAADRTPTSSSCHRQKIPAATPSSPASPFTPSVAAASESSPGRRPPRPFSPSSKTPTRSNGRNSGIGNSLRRSAPCRVRRPPESSKDSASPTSTPRKPLSAAASCKLTGAADKPESRLPRPDFAAFAVLRAAAAAVKGRTAPELRGSPKRFGGPSGRHQRVASPGPRYSDTPKKLLRRSTAASAPADAASATLAGASGDTAGSPMEVIKAGTPSASPKSRAVQAAAAAEHSITAAGATTTAALECSWPATPRSGAVSPSSSGGFNATQEAQLPEPPQQQQQQLSPAPTSRRLERRVLRISSSRAAPAQKHLAAPGASKAKLASPSPKSAVTLGSKPKHKVTQSAAAKRSRSAETDSRRTLRRTEINK